MIRKQFLLLLVFLFSITAFAQFDLNDYKYVVIPRQYDFLKSPDQYQVNSLTKFLLEKENFIVLIDDVNPPKDLASNRCLALYGNVLDGSKLFKTKLSFTLKDCNNNEVFATQEGASKEKNFQKAYHEALRNAFKSFDAINYSYQPKLVEEKVVEVTSKPEVIKVEVVQPKKDSVLVKEEPKPISEAKPTIISTSNILYAQKVSGGYQLVDNTPKIVMLLLETSKADVFVVKGQDTIVYKEDGFWYMSNGATSTKKMEIKF